MTWSTDVVVAATAVVAGFVKIIFGVGAGAMITPLLCWSRARNSPSPCSR